MADRTVTVGSGKTYSTPALAVAGEADFQTGEDNIVFVVDAASYNKFSIASEKFTTSTSHKVKFQCASGAGHSLARSTGVRIVNSTDWSPCFTSDVAYTEIYGFAFSNPRTNGGYGALFSVSGCVLYGCLFYDCKNYAVRFTASSGSCYLINSAIINCGGGVYAAGSHTTYIYNVTCINSDTYGLYHSGYGTRNLKNCYFGGSGTADYYKASTGTVNLTTCRSSDGTLSTTTVSLANCGFTSYTDGSEDVHISSSSSLRDIGTDLSSDSVYAFSTDCLGNTRSGSWDIGAVEYIAASGGPLVGDSALVGGSVLCGQGNLIN
jgi:hypothetical protein